jgi:hypothetical protein
MFLQSAELRLIGAEARMELELSCGLSNIARGSCILRLLPADLVPAARLGTIEVQIERPVMRGELHLQRASFETVLLHLRREPPRPTAIVVLLAESLDINVQGDLRISAARHLTVTDISFNVPLQ